MSRIPATFDALKKEHRKALIPFITAGDPEPTATVELMHAMAAAGADLIELGVPFSDPMADGPAIQRSSERALKHDVSLNRVLEMVAEFRTTDAKTPVVLMGYANPIEAMGYEAFAAGARQSGVDGVIVVDYPPEEWASLAGELGQREIDAIFLLSPTTTAARIEHIARYAQGYIYYVSLRGVTGAANLDVSEIAAKLPQIRKQVKLPIGVGFGIRDPQTARAVANIADAVVIGTRVVQEIENSPRERVTDNIGTLIRSFRNALDS